MKKLDLKTVDDWIAYTKSGNKPENIPFNPNRVYEGWGWRGWRWWLGSMNYINNYISWKETEQFIIDNDVSNSTEWVKLSSVGKIPVNIPINLLYYDEWTSWNNYGSRCSHSKFRRFEDAVKFVNSLGFKTKKEWREYCLSGNKPDDIPTNLSSISGSYREEWKGWSYWLGSILNVKSKSEIGYLLNIVKDELETLDAAEILVIIEKFNLDKRFTNVEPYLNLLKSEPFSVSRKLNAKLLRREFGVDFPIRRKIEKEIEEFATVHDINLKKLDNKNSREIEKTIGVTNEPNVITSLKFLDNNFISVVLDEEKLQFLIDYRIQKLCNDFINERFTIEELTNETGGEYFTYVKNQFLNQYEDVVNLEIPEGYSFEDEDGNVLEPNFMQKLTALKVKNKKRFGNWSEAGAGKTLSAILSTRYTDSKNNLIIAFNSTIDYWKESILNAYPDSIVNTKNNKEIIWVEGKYNYLILNYETFQQDYSSEFANTLLNEIEFDFIVLDEIQNAKQRKNNVSSKRKDIIHKLLIKSTTLNPDIHFLFMSCSPIINNLVEPIKMLEMLNGVSYKELNPKPTIFNAINVHKHFVINGIRYLSKSHDVNLDEIILKINGEHLIDKIRCISHNNILEIEKILIHDKLSRISKELRPGTMIYTYYVQDIVDTTSHFIEDMGYSVGFYTGGDKTGLESFISGELDILIGSFPISMGVDGIQKICNRIIVLTLPWTSSEYENLIGRIKRQGSNFDNVEVVIPQIEIDLGGDKWSWDDDRLDRIKYKKTLADTTLDGQIAEDNLPSKKEMVKMSLDSIQKWIDRVENDEMITIDRNKIVKCI